jgi:hypothetical protein
MLSVLAAEAQAAAEAELDARVPPPALQTFAVFTVALAERCDQHALSFALHALEVQGVETEFSDEGVELRVRAGGVSSTAEYLRGMPRLFGQFTMELEEVRS